MLISEYWCVSGVALVFSIYSLSESGQWDRRYDGEYGIYKAETGVVRWVLGFLKIYGFLGF